MSKILNILLFIVFFLLFSFLIFSTFFVPQYKSIEEISSLNFKSGVFSLNFWEDSKLVEKELSEEDLMNEEKAFVYKINYLDNLYFDKPQSYNFSSSGSLESIDLKKSGVFLLDINDLSKNYKISHKWFIIEPLSVWRIFIDTNDSKNILILSKDSTFRLSFKDIRNGSVLTKSYFFPHEFIKFNPLKNLSLKNADFLRVTTVSSAWYIKDRLISDFWISDSLSRLASIESTSFLKLVFKDFASRDSLNTKNYNDLKSISLWEFPWKDMIEKYISFFYNDSKKTVYYKNNILVLIDKLFRSKTHEKPTIDDLVLYLNKLRELDSQEYDNILRIISYYDKVVSLENTSNSIESKLNFSYLKDSLNGLKIKVYEDKSLISLSSLYSLFDSWNKSFSLKDFDLFVNSFLKSLSVNIENNKIFVSDMDNSLFIDYFTYFFKNLLVSNLSLKQDFSVQDIDSNLKLINKYMLLSDFIYFNDSDLRKKTWLYENLEFSKKLSVFLRLNFFEKDRSKEWLLVLRSDNSLSNSSLKFLEKNIEKVIDNFTTNRDLISNREKDIIDYEKMKLEFPEYFLALFSYDKYSLEYDIIKKNLLDIDTINESESNELTEKDFINYISSFNWLDLSSVKVEIVEGYYFEVSNLFINWLSFSFNLYPYDSNTIEDINIYWNWIISEKERIKIWRNSYNLDFIKESLLKKTREYTWEDKYKYDFKNFFVNTFFTENKDDVADSSNNNNDDNNLEEDKFVVVFKKNKLLWDSWEFSSIKDTLDVKYNDIKVTRNGNNYETYLDKVLFTVDVTDVSKKRFNWELSSDYILTSENHDFKNIRLKVYDRYTENEWTKFLIWWNYINLIWTVIISELENELYNIFKDFNNIFIVYDKVKSNLSITDLDIKHYVSSGNTKFSLNYDNSSLVIQLSWDEIEYITFSWKKIASNLNLDKLGIVLDRINK